VFFFIIGFGKRTVDYLSSAGTRVCPHCGNTAEWNNVSIRSWFTLFFIPVFPYKTQHVAMCPICKYGSET
jgi:hypothetical protein